MGWVLRPYHIFRQPLWPKEAENYSCRNKQNVHSKIIESALRVPCTMPQYQATPNHRMTLGTSNFPRRQLSKSHSPDLSKGIIPNLRPYCTPQNHLPRRSKRIATAELQNTKISKLPLLKKTPQRKSLFPPHHPSPHSFTAPLHLISQHNVLQQRRLLPTWRRPVPPRTSGTGPGKVCTRRPRLAPPRQAAKLPRPLFLQRQLQRRLPQRSRRPAWRRRPPQS